MSDNNENWFESVHREFLARKERHLSAGDLTEDEKYELMYAHMTLWPSVTFDRIPWLFKLAKELEADAGEIKDPWPKEERRPKGEE